LGKPDVGGLNGDICFFGAYRPNGKIDQAQDSEQRHQGKPRPISRRPKQGVNH
jgi:hypothetical protein